MAATYILFMSHIHALLDLHHGSKLQVKLGDLLCKAGQKYQLWAKYGRVDLIFFENYLYDYYSAHLSTTFILQNFI
jgi:hypothetical protein